MVLYYDVVFALSLLLLLIYTFMWHRHFDVLITLMFVLVPITNLGYSLLARAENLQAALNANKLTYLGGCYQLLVIMLVVFSLCKINLNRWLRTGFLALSTLVYLASLTSGSLPWFYRSVRFERVDGAALLWKEYGFMHTVFYVMIFAYLLLSLAAIVYSYLRKKQVSRKTLILLFLTEATAAVAFFAGRGLLRLIQGEGYRQLELIPAAYVLALIIYLIIVYRIGLYDTTDTAIDTMIQSGDTGFATFDFRLNYLGSNRTARAILPALRELTVDKPLSGCPELKDTALRWLDAFREDEKNNRCHYEKGKKIYLVTVNWLYDGRKRRGYEIFLTDDTSNQQYIRLLNGYNTELQSEVAEKTAHIEEMHEKLVLGMATMVESRDNSTGGHIRRTSEGVRLLTEAMGAREDFDLSPDFCRDLIKAAPMHDLGKIAVDDQVLRKPGRFTPEEYEKMKAHADEGARIVGEILRGTEDEDFRRIAVNVAHYHHERWDGTGYPEGLKGEAIPIEARIMAIADVYDALVSRRVYKEEFSFERADAIILEGMGRQFDKRLEPCYLSARPALERYYRELG